MATSIESTQLDFARIKESLRTHFLSTDAFADYDFEASALDAILDVLAYNTHYNGLIANFGLNEAFLNTAQLRGSVLAIAESLGYNPRSKTASSAIVNLSITNTTPGRPSVISLPENIPFTATIDDTTYTFYNLEEYIGVDDGTGYYQFLDGDGNANISIYEGTLKQKTFLVSSNENPIYIIPDENMDTSTAVVRVYQNRNSSVFNTYLPYSQAFSVSPDSRFYGLREAPNGYFELYFGDGSVIGKKPSVGEVIIVTYLSTNGADANLASGISANSTLTVNGQSYNINVTTVSRSAGGEDKEAISSIKQNAPIQFAAQNRLVTSEDYIALISSNYGSYLNDITAWGGEDNIPPTFGKVFVSLDYKTGVSTETQTSVQNDIQNNLAAGRSIMSIDTSFVAAEKCFLETSTFFNFNPALTTTTVGSIEAQINSLISNYFTNNLNKFNKVFRRSSVLAEIDDLSEAVLNSRMEVKVQRRFTPVLAQSRAYEVIFPIALSEPQSDVHTITSNRFTVDDQLCVIRNILNSTTLQVINADDDSVVVNNIGSYTPETGKVNLIGFNPISIDGTATDIRISAIPGNQSTVRPLRNFIISLDEGKSFSSAQIDYQRIKVTL